MDSPILKENGEHPRHFSPPFTLKYIQALAIKDGDFQIKLVDCLVTPIPLEKLVNDVLIWDSDLLIVSSSTHSYEQAIQFCSLIKSKKNIFTVAIGQGPTAHSLDYSFSASSFDIALRGEAEKEVISLLEALKSGKSEKEISEEYQHKSSKNEVNLIWDLDHLPFPEYTPLETEAYRYLYPIRTWKRLRWGHILSSRGCQHGCIFCSQIIRETYGSKVRLRSPANVVDEIEYLRSKGVNIVAFDDDNFTALSKHIIGICKEILRRKLKVKWIAHARVDELNVFLITLMKRAGCVLLRFGIESASERIIKIIQKNPRNINWTETSKSILSCCRRAGITTNALFIIGNPGETAEEMKATIKLSKELSPDLVQVHFFTPYPGSAICENSHNHALKINELLRMHHYIYPQINLSNVSADDLITMRAVFYGSFLLRPFFLLGHFFNFLLFYINNIECSYAFSKILKIIFQRRGEERS